MQKKLLFTFLEEKPEKKKKKILYVLDFDEVGKKKEKREK